MTKEWSWWKALPDQGVKTCFHLYMKSYIHLFTGHGRSGGRAGRPLIGRFMVQSLAACQRARCWTPNCSEWLLHQWVSGYKVLYPTLHEVHHSGCCIKQPFTERPNKTLSHYLLEQFCFFWLFICVTEQQELLVGEVFSRRLSFKCQNIKLTGLLCAQEDRGSLFF